MKQLRDCYCFRIVCNEKCKLLLPGGECGEQLEGNCPEQMFRGDLYGFCKECVESIKKEALKNIIRHLSKKIKKD